MFGAWTEIFLHAFVVAAAAWLAVVAARNPDAIAFALKSILRRWRITSVVMATILVCVVALVALGGYFYHSFWGLSESTIRSETGHFQIYRKGYEANSKTDPWTWKLRQLREIRDLFASDTFLAHREQAVVDIPDVPLLVGIDKVEAGQRLKPHGRTPLRQVRCLVETIVFEWLPHFVHAGIADGERAPVGL